MRRFQYVLAIAAAAGLSARASAQIPNVKATFGNGYVTPPGVVYGGYYVGPYTGSIKIGSDPTIPVVFNCVDFFHDVMSGQVWTATLTNLGTGAGIGTTDANSTTRLYGSETVNNVTVSALDVYRAAAYLISTYPVPASSNPNGTIKTQDEIWQMTSLFYPQSGQSYYQTGNTRWDGYSYQTQLTPAQLASTITTDDNVGGFNYSNWWVVTVQGQTDKDKLTSPQEFIINQPIATPEPGTLALLGTGLSSLVGAGFVRRRRGSANPSAA